VGGRDATYESRPAVAKIELSSSNAPVNVCVLRRVSEQASECMCEKKRLEKGSWKRPMTWRARSRERESGRERKR